MLAVPPRRAAVALALLLSLGFPGAVVVGQQPPTPPAPAPTLPYADVADLVLKSPIIVDATVRGVEKIKGAESAGLAPGLQRLLVTADLVNLVRAPAALPPQIGYLIDVPIDAKGHLPRLKKQRVLLFARTVAGQANQVQLTGTTSQQPWTPALDALTRQVTADVVAPTSPPAITGIGNAFHVPGSLPGEGETQIFLTTADGRPVSLSIIRRPGEAPRWAVALSEIVDEAAAPPPRDTLLWYRLACFLPAALPDRSLAADDNDNAAQARADYQFVRQSLGPCTRTLG